MEFPSLEVPAIIAFKGLPCTFKTYAANLIAIWSRSPILLIDDFFDLLYPNAGETGDSSPTADEAKRLHHLAFDLLCKVAATQLCDEHTQLKCVVIKSRLCSTFELDRLTQLAQLKSNRPHPLLIIESQMRNEFQWQRHFDIDEYKHCWYRPKNWNEVEMVRLDYDAHAWDRYFLQSIKELPDERRRFIRRLVLDSTKDPTEDAATGGIGDDFADAIKYLLTGKIDELHKLQPVIEYAELRRSRLERILKSPKVRVKYHKNPNNVCRFKFVEEQEWLEREDYKDSFCSACEERISGPRYACYYCIRALHKSCAETPELVKVASYDLPESLFPFPETHACDVCREGGKAFSYKCYACIFKMHLKYRLMPTIVNHDAHMEHSLIIWLKPVHFTCKACGCHGFYHYHYSCLSCQYSYHPRCVALPRELKHEHGGYVHTMKLMYSINEHDKEEQEDFWCDACFEDIDPQCWFYSCRECPYYVAHMDKVSKLPCGTHTSAP